MTTPAPAPAPAQKTKKVAFWPAVLCAQCGWAMRGTTNLKFSLQVPFHCVNTSCVDHNKVATITLQTVDAPTV